MAHSNNSIITGKFKGTLGKELVFREWEGKTVVAKAPKRREGEPTAAQAEVQEKFLMASRYAKAIIDGNDPDLLEGYKAILRPRQNVYSRAVEDFMSAPVVKNIRTENYTGATGDKIAVRAIDDFRVTRVRVEIYSAGGPLLEAGNAQQGVNGLDWIYISTQVNSALSGSVIRAIAIDIPGNEGTLQVTL